jgi:hypothetical protein
MRPLFGLIDMFATSYLYQFNEKTTNKAVNKWVLKSLEKAVYYG